MVKKIFLVFGIIILLAMITLELTLMPTPNFLRNNKVDGIEMTVRLPEDERLPIIKSYKAKDYENKSEKKKQNIEDKTNGKIEGDIPCINIKSDKNLYIKFKKDGEEVRPDEVPKIQITSKKYSYLDDEDSKLIEDKVTEYKDGEYVYPLSRYRVQYEKYFLENNFIKLTYRIDNEEYISLFSISTSNVEDGTLFFENEKLESPIPAEI